MRNILLATEEEAKQLASSLLISKSVGFETEYMGTRRTTGTVHGLLADTIEDRMGIYFSSL